MGLALGNAANGNAALYFNYKNKLVYFMLDQF
jgi:hypothetical protein